MSVSPTKILLATDGSGGATPAARAAVGISLSTDSELHLVYVTPEPANPCGYYQYYPSETWSGVPKRAEEGARAVLEAQRRLVEAEGGSVEQVHLGHGRPAAEIVGLADRLGAGLVVVGSRGVGSLRRALMGSVSDSVSRRAHAPVLVVRADGEARTAKCRRPASDKGPMTDETSGERWTRDDM